MVYAEKAGDPVPGSSKISYGSAWYQVNTVRPDIVGGSDQLVCRGVEGSLNPFSKNVSRA